MNHELICHRAFVMIMMSDMLTMSDFSPSGTPCVYEGRLNTAKNWFGYLANMTVLVSGRMLFEFTYPAKHCCQNVLFYSDEQIAFVSPHMTCWQKEYILRPERDQILRLTPRFSWSGCHLVRPAGQLVYACEGGRSFAVYSEARRASTWYLAVSNCAARSGLHLCYRLLVYGVIGQCQYQFHEAGDSLLARLSAQSELRHATPGWYDTLSRSPCVVEGTVSSRESWFGFLANMSLVHGGGFRFYFRFPLLASVAVVSQSLSVLLYTADDVNKLDVKQSCWQRYTVIRDRYHSEQLIEIGSKSSWNGCASENSTDNGLVVMCRSERRFDGPRQYYVAVSNCRHPDHGVRLWYRLEIHGYDSVEQYCITCRAYVHIMLIISCIVISLLAVLST